MVAIVKGPNTDHEFSTALTALDLPTIINFFDNANAATAHARLETVAGVSEPHTKSLRSAGLKLGPLITLPPLS